MIRLAYGLEAGNGTEIGAGLAALVCGKLGIDIAPEGRERAPSVETGLAHLSQALAGTRIEGTWIAPRLRAVAQLPAFQAALPAMPQNIDFADLLSALRQAALATYWQTDDFVALHMVTGLHAARIVLARLPQAMAQRYLPELWSAFCAAYVVIGSPALQLPSSDPIDEDWPALFALAVAADDDHDIKLAHACFEENRVSPSPLYHAAAMRRLSTRRARAA